MHTKIKILSAFLVITLCSLATLGIHKAIVHAQTDPVAEREAQLRAELDQVLKEIDAQQAILNTEKQKSTTLQGDLNILNAQIQKAKLNIRAKELTIATLGKDINVKTQTITQLTGKIEDTRASIAQLIRKTNEMDAFTLPDVILSDKDISSFFADVDAYGSIKQSIQVALGSIKKTKEDTEVAKQTLDKRRLQEIDAKISIEDEKAQIEKSEREKARLLALSKAQQQNYQSEISKRQAKAAQIRSALFALRDTGAIPFGKALEYATAAGSATGIRPAFLLAILTQESNLGQNVGTCYVTDFTNGDGKKISTGAFVDGVMKPSRDIQPFLRITGALGRDPATTRVSCPFSTGYGGAMGPSQFIPSTWELFQARIGAALGVATPDPWEPRHAFMASAIYLADLGADAQTYSAERNAACRYYSGRACDTRSPANAFYGNQVTAKAASIQKDMIDPLSGV
ncbi:MAG: peptidase [Candidatus Paceibacter sp.]|jgi:peptidoglycan hydrolase CwlO-like protein|nr:peptidase [Candidatus Paceibacter sp.]